MDADNNKITCPKCNSQNIQSEGVIHLCMDCGYKWEDEIQTDLGEMIIYQSDEGVRLDVRLENKTVWLSIEQISQLFNKGRTTISEHISNIFKEGELEEKVVCRKFRQTTFSNKVYLTLSSIFFAIFFAHKKRSNRYFSHPFPLAYKLALSTITNYSKIQQTADPYLNYHYNMDCHKHKKYHHHHNSLLYHFSFLYV